MFSFLARHKATLLGLLAIVLWSSITGLIRLVSEGLGPIGGAAMIYSVSTLFLLAVMGWPKLRQFPRVYLIAGSVLFVAYEICLSLALGYANSRTQAIELSMINYLWPCFTVLMAIVFNGQRATWWVIPGMLLSLVGIGWIMNGGNAGSLAQLLHNVHSNPLSYGLVFSGALLWAAYCNVTRKSAQGHNGVVLFMLLTAALLCVGVAMGAGYAAWNVGILRGNMALLAAASYFTPVLSSVLAAIVLSTVLSINFWQGVAMVTLGSLVCWWATRR